jgi:hypothetical protein
MSACSQPSQQTVHSPQARSTDWGSCIRRRPLAGLVGREGFGPSTNGSKKTARMLTQRLLTTVDDKKIKALAPRGCPTLSRLALAFCGQVPQECPCSLADPTQIPASLNRPGGISRRIPYGSSQQSSPPRAVRHAGYWRAAGRPLTLLPETQAMSRVVSAPVLAGSRHGVELPMRVGELNQLLAHHCHHTGPGH